MNNQTKMILVLGAILLGLGLFQPDFSNWINIDRVVVVDVSVNAPEDKVLRDKAVSVAEILQAGGFSRKTDAVRLRDLYLDLAQLITLDGDDLVIKNTEEIRQANSLAGVMLRLDIKGKYTDLASTCNDLIVTAIGDDNINLSPELRTKAVEAFKALAWGCNEGSK